MKKLISMLAVLTMIFSLFAMVPAYAEETVYEGTFNITNKALAVGVYQNLYLNLSKGTVPADATIQVSTRYRSGNSPAGTSFPTTGFTNASNSNTGAEVVAGGECVRIYPVKNKAEYNWRTNTGTDYKKNGQVWEIVSVKINGKLVYKTGTTEQLGLIFQTQNQKGTISITTKNGTAWEDNATNVATDETITYAVPTNHYFVTSKRGESTVATVTADGVALTEGVDFTYQQVDGAVNKYVLAPVDAWQPGTTYLVNMKIRTTDYPQNGEPITNGSITKDETITFTTAGEKPDLDEPGVDPDPDEPVDPDPDEPVDPDPEDPVDPVTPVADVVKIHDIFYNNTTREISFWVHYYGDGTDAKPARFEADIIVAGYSNGKLVSVSKMKDFSIIKRTSSSSFSRNCIETKFDLANATDIKIFILKEGKLQPYGAATEIKAENLVRLNGVPESSLAEGQLAAVKRADQLSNFEFTPVADGMATDYSSSNANKTTYSKGRTYVGLPYSSCEPNDKFICENVSFETFLTAVANPDSVLYTKNIKTTKAGTSNNGATYYGIVCNGFVRYCLGIEQRCNTQNWLDIPGMSVVKEIGKFTANDIQIGDVLHAHGDGENHVAMITDILKDDSGNVVAIEVSESGRLTVKRRIFATAESNSVNKNLFTTFTKYRLCRYDYLKSIPAFDEAQDAIAKSGLDKVAPVIAVNYGNKSNYLEGETVGISYFGEDAGTIVIEKDGVVIEEISVDGPKNGKNKIEKANLAPGFYKVKVAGTDYMTEFCVCSYKLSSDLSGTTLTVTVDMDELKKSGSEIAHMDFRMSSSAGFAGLATKGMLSLTEDEKETGVIVKTCTSNASNYKVYFKNKYGIWTHEMKPIG